MLLLRYRELRDAPGLALDRICTFLGVRTGLVATIPRENVRPHVRPAPHNRLLQEVLRGGAAVGHQFPLAVRQAFRAPLLAALQRGGSRRPRITPEERARVLPFFVTDIQRLQEVTGDSYSDWLSPDHNTARPAVSAERRRAQRG